MHWKIWHLKLWWLGLNDLDRASVTATVFLVGCAIALMVFLWS